MSDPAPGTRQAPKRGRRSAKKSTPLPAGEVTVIQVPRPPASAMNRNRPISELIKAQLQHIRHAESGRLPKQKRIGVKLQDIHTEAEAASYIAAVTKLLHPRGKKKARPKQGR
jgi:hypothetical protein